MLFLYYIRDTNNRTLMQAPPRDLALLPIILPIFPGIPLVALTLVVNYVIIITTTTTSTTTTTAIIIATTTTTVIIIATTTTTITTTPPLLPPHHHHHHRYQKININIFFLFAFHLFSD